MDSPPHPATRLWLVRHAQTDWNRDGKIQGRTPTDLNEAGRAEARQLADFLAPRKYVAVVSSDLPRAASTAALLAAPHHLPVQMDERLRERSFGPWEGQTAAAVREARRSAGGAPLGNDLAAWSDVPGVEADEAVAQRMFAALTDFSTRWPRGDVLVVTHGGTLSRAVFEILGIPRHHPRRFPLSNGIIAVLNWQDGHLRLASLLDAHLLIHGVEAGDTATVRSADSHPA